VQAARLFEGDWMGDEMNTEMMSEVVIIGIELGTGVQKTEIITLYIGTLRKGWGPGSCLACHGP